MHGPGLLARLDGETRNGEPGTVDHPVLHLPATEGRARKLPQRHRNCGSGVTGTGSPMRSRKAFSMTEYIPTPEDDALEATIGRLFDQLEVREDSAEYWMIVRRWVRSMASSTCSIIGLAARLIFRDSQSVSERGDGG
jgi:hypothetical protein